MIGLGITTIFHSISIANSTICNRERTLSVPQMIGIGDAINQYDAQMLIHHRFHTRLELNTIEAFESILNRIKSNQSHELSLMDHTPGQGQHASLDTFKVEIRKQYGDISESQMLSIIKECQAKPLLTSAQISELLECTNSMGIPIAFHDLETDRQLLFMKEYGIRIAEFPLSTDISARAAADGFFNVVGAPNIIVYYPSLKGTAGIPTSLGMSAVSLHRMNSVPGMLFREDVPLLLACHMGVDLRCHYRTVSKQLLNISDINSLIQ